LTGVGDAVSAAAGNHGAKHAIKATPVRRIAMRFIRPALSGDIP
jgi:hypothetical protein